ncbi:MAG: hypothetical protein EOP51_11135 [Sphingobacteriales bacterium]|nr:MAG: hypothetical protein EOP51_11135 [Sphingobacteriales bacterium]
MKVSPNERIDAVNIGLIFLSGIMAMVIPFELFLFSYAVLGPLHYLTEISWLHDKKYFTKGKYDAVYMAVICLCLTIIFLNGFYHYEIDIPPTMQSNLTWIALMLAVLFVSVKSTMYRILGMLAILISVAISNMDSVIIYLTVFLPTLIHVYFFTGLFMLYGALKSKSKLGLISVLCFVLCPVLLVTLFPDTPFYPVTNYGMNAYTGGTAGLGFSQLHIEIMNRFMGQNVMAHTAEEARDMWYNIIFHSQAGIVIARLIAFAYTYHYLNWFSKTRVIQWHKVPKGRFAVVIAGWIASVSLYLVDYTVGLVWLFFLSILHVLLELPLNVTSVIGIWRSFRNNRSDKQPIAAKG